MTPALAGLCPGPGEGEMLGQGGGLSVGNWLCAGCCHFPQTRLGNEGSWFSPYLPSKSCG